MNNSYSLTESWYTLEQIYYRFGVRASKVRYAVNHGYINAQKVTASRGDGYKYLVQESSFLKWLKNPPKRGRRKAEPGPIVTTHYIREEEPLVIKDFTPIGDILKEGQTMSVGEIMEKVDNAIVEEPKPTYSEENFGDGWVTVSEAATLCDRHRTVVNTAILDGSLKATRKNNRTWMIKLEDLENWMNSKRSNKPGPKAKKELVLSPEEAAKVIETANETIRTHSSYEDSYRGFEWKDENGNTIRSRSIPTSNPFDSSFDSMRSIFDKAVADAKKEGYDEGYTAGFEAAWHEVEDKVLKALGLKIEE